MKKPLILIILFFGLIGIVAGRELRIDNLEWKSDSYGTINTFSGTINKYSICEQDARDKTCINIFNASTSLAGTGFYLPFKTIRLGRGNLDIIQIQVIPITKTYQKEVEYCALEDENEECIEYARYNETWVSYDETNAFLWIENFQLKKNAYYILKFKTPLWSSGTFNISFFDPDVSACVVLSGPFGTIHSMTTDVQSEGNCMIIGNHSITLDCAGHSINYSQISTGSGVFAEGKLNITIKNCIINMWNSTAAGATVGVNGTTFSKTNYSSLINMTYATIGNWSWGIGAHTSTNITINNISIMTNGTNRAYAISFVSCANITANNIDIFTSGAVATGLRFGVNTQNATFSNMNITTKGATSCAIQIDSSPMNTFTNFVANSSLDASIILTGVSYNIFKNFTVNTTTGNAIQLTTDSFNNSFDDFNSFGNAGGGYGIRLIIRSRNNTFSNGRINTSGTAGRGIYLLTNSSGNSFANMSINAPVADCVYISSSQLNIFKNINCTGVAANTYGFYFLANGSNNYVNNSNVFTNGQNAFGIFITNSSHNFFQYMNITTLNSSAYGAEVAETSTNNTIDLSVIMTFGTSAAGYRRRNLGENNTVSNSIINTSAVSAPKIHYVNQTYGNEIFNVTYEGQSRNQTYIGGVAGITDGDSYIINIINLNRSAIICGATTNLNNVTIQWQVKINVTDHAGNPIDGAICNSTNFQGVFQDFGTSGADGLTNGIRMNESFFDCSPARIYYNLTNITCSGGVEINSTNITITSNNTINIRLGSGAAGDTIHPIQNQISPPNATTTNAATVTFNCSAFDETQLKNISLYIWNDTVNVYNNTQNLTNQENSTTWTIDLLNGSYWWDCVARDNSSNEDENYEEWNLTIANQTPQDLTIPNCWISWVNISNKLHANFTIVNGSPILESYTELYNFSDMIQNISPLANWIWAMETNSTYNITCFVRTLNGSTFNSTNATDIVFETSIPLDFIFFPQDMETYQGSGELSFLCRAYDDNGLANVTIYVKHANNDIMVFNSTATTSDLSYNFSMNISLNTGDYEWWCNATNVFGSESANDSVFYFYFSKSAAEAAAGGGGSDIPLIAAMLVSGLAFVGGWKILTNGK